MSDAPTLTGPAEEETVNIITSHQSEMVGEEISDQQSLMLAAGKEDGTTTDQQLLLGPPSSNTGLTSGSALEEEQNNTSHVLAPGWSALPNTPPVEMKLFVGRVPRTADESVLRPLFEEFGVVSEIAIIKDRNTSVHKGSAFVRMASITQADHSIRVLNGQKVLDPQLGPLQVRYATGEAEKLGMTPESSSPGSDQAKLFVGSLPKNATEEDVRAVFNPIGQIDEIFIMKDSATGLGKGCAFVKFAYKEQAINAIKTISGQHLMQGAPRPLEVRFAESKRSGAAGATAGTTTTSAGMTAAAGGAIAGPGAFAQPLGGGALSGQGGYAAGLGGMGAGAGLMQTAAANAGGQAHYPAAAAAAGAAQSLAVANSYPRSAGHWKEYFTEDGRPYYHNEQTAQTQWERPPEFDRQDVAGPPGANIFVFHVPNDWTQNDLVQSFSSFGPIVSARIATDKATNRNKGYAFVSYANIHSAAQAVQNMNGYMAGTKRLKVSIKQNEEVYVAHLLNNPAAVTAGGQQPQQQLAAAVAAAAAAPAMLNHPQQTMGVYRAGPTAAGYMQTGRQVPTGTESGWYSSGGEYGVVEPFAGSTSTGGVNQTGGYMAQVPTRSLNANVLNSAAAAALSTSL